MAILKIQIAAAGLADAAEPVDQLLLAGAFGKSGQLLFDPFRAGLACLFRPVVAEVLLKVASALGVQRF